MGVEYTQKSMPLKWMVKIFYAYAYFFLTIRYTDKIVVVVGLKKEEKKNYNMRCAINMKIDLERNVSADCIDFCGERKKCLR